MIPITNVKGPLMKRIVDSTEGMSKERFFFLLSFQIQQL